MINVVNFKFKFPENSIIINTTSRSNNWSRGLSPFVIGPVPLYSNYISKTMENLWQYSKLYQYYADENGDPTEEYFEWAQAGWNSTWANRYPMGKDIIPLCSYWDGEKLDYVSARKRIYIPSYSNAVQKTTAFSLLKDVYNKNNDIYLIDFDAHNLSPGTFDYWDLANNSNIKFGHAYVLAMILEGYL